MTLFALIVSAMIASCPSDPIDMMFRLYGGRQPGASIAVIKDGSVVYERSFGLANVETGERATSQTNYRIASITKGFTATAILLLAERGTLAIDDVVSKHIPELATAAPGVTLRHLLTHTSGLPEYEAILSKETKEKGKDKEKEKEVEAADQLLDRDVLALVAQHKLEFTPGTKYKYNNSGYAILALVVERVSKLSFSDFLRRDIFGPVGMKTTVAYDAKASIAHRAYGYSVTDNVFARADQTRTTAVLGDGGIYSSTHDLARWVDALGRNTLLDAKRFADATTPHIATDAPGVGYGYGWKIGEQQGEKLVFHTGTTSGFRHVLLWVPSRKLAVVVLTNRRQGDPFTLGSLVLDRFWKR